MISTIATKAGLISIRRHGAVRLEVPRTPRLAPELLTDSMMPISTRWVIVFLAAIVLNSGCPLENPRLGCAPVSMYIAADTSGSQLDNNLADLTAITLDGAACPTVAPACHREPSPNGGVPGPCLSFWISPVAEGTCRATLTFSDRDTFVAETSFGPHIDGRCSGFPAQGDSIFYIPARATAGGARD